jgi:uncharacterized protein HemX
MELDRESLLRQKEHLEQEMDQVRDQIERAKVRQIETGKYADPDWWRRANQVLRIKGRQVQAIQNELGGLKKHKASTWERAFVEAAERRLDPEVYQTLRDEAYYATNRTDGR